MTDTTSEHTMVITIPLRDFVERLGLATDQTWLRPVAVSVTGNEVHIAVDGSGVDLSVGASGRLAATVADRAKPWDVTGGGAE